MNHARGFTLIELAIVLVIITFLIGGLAAPLSAQIQARRLAEARADMQAIQDALIGYAMSHRKQCNCTYDGSGALTSTPCPLCPYTGAANDSYSMTRHFLPCPYTTPNTDPDKKGKEDERDDTTGNCPSVRGGLPWVTLGVKGQDPWGNRYTYAVTSQYSNDITGFTSTPTPDPGDLDVYPDDSCATASVAEKVAAVVVSHGPNSLGARNVNIDDNDQTPSPPSSTSNDELQNLNRAASLLPCNDVKKFVSTTPSDTYDDLVIWLSRNKLFSRVCPDGGCS